jgi:hypothetical protein
MTLQKLQIIFWRNCIAFKIVRHCCKGLPISDVAILGRQSNSAYRGLFRSYSNDVLF